MAKIGIAGRPIGAGEPVFLIAEAGVNHNGDPAMAVRLVDVAAETGADAVKFQTFEPECVASSWAPKAQYQLRATDGSESQLSMLRQLKLPREAHTALRERCRQRGVIFLSTPFDPASVDFLASLGVPAFKVGSGDLTNHALLKQLAHTGKPVLLSTGMSYLEEVEEAVQVLRQAGCQDLALMHCVSNYPADAADANLRVIPEMAARFGVPVGFSDHTPGIEVAVAAVALGACVIEKHFTLDKNLPGPDHRASLDPGELRALVVAVRSIEKALGNGRKVPASSEMENRILVRRSVAAACAIAPGTVLREEMLQLLRPETGIPAKDMERVVGRVTRRGLAPGQLLDWADLE